MYLWGWLGLSPIVLIIGLIGFVSYGFAPSALLDGLWTGVLNLGILWTGIFLLITVGRVLVGFVLRLTGNGKQKPNRIQHSFCRELLEACAFGWTILLVTGFVAEFVAQSTHSTAGLFAVLAYGFLPITLLAAALAYLRFRT